MHACFTVQTAIARTSQVDHILCYVCLCIARSIIAIGHRHRSSIILCYAYHRSSPSIIDRSSLGSSSQTLYCSPTHSHPLILAPANMVKLTGQFRVMFTDTYAKACDANQDKIVTLMDATQQILIESGVARKLRLPPKCVGVRPKNRGGKKMPPLAMNAKGSKIASVGFSPKLCSVDRWWGTTITSTNAWLS